MFQDREEFTKAVQQGQVASLLIGQWKLTLAFFFNAVQIILIFRNEL
jgi:hypothetical protein